MENIEIYKKFLQSLSPSIDIDKVKYSEKDNRIWVYFKDQEKDHVEEELFKSRVTQSPYHNSEVKQKPHSYTLSVHELKADIVNSVRNKSLPLNEKSLIEYAVKEDPSLIKSLGKPWIEDRDIIIAALEKDGSLLAFLPVEFQKDLDLVKIAIKNDPSALKYADKSIRGDLNTVKGLIKEFPDALSFVDSSLINNQELENISINSKKTE